MFLFFGFFGFGSPLGCSCFLVVVSLFGLVSLFILVCLVLHLGWDFVFFGFVYLLFLGFAA